MKSLLLAVVLLVLSVRPIYAQEFATVSASPNPEVMGLYDDELDATDSATPSAAPDVRTTTYIDPSDAPVSGTFETSLMIFFAGISFILLGIRFSR